MRQWTTFCLFLLAASCSNGDAAYQKALSLNDVDGLKAYIESYPEGEHREGAANAIDEILWKRASSDDSAASYAAYLTESPSGSHKQQAAQLARTRAYEDAEKANSLDVWQAFLNAYPADDKLDKFAKHRVEVLAYAPQVHWQPFTIERGNMQGKRKGPEDGYRFTTVFTNSGDRLVRMIRLQVQFWKEDSVRPVKESTWYPVVPKGAMEVMSLPPDWAPLKANGGRSAVWTLGDIDTPRDWDKTPETVKLVLEDLWIE